MKARIAWITAVLVTSLACVAMAQQGTPDERIEMVKQSFAASQQALKQYEWVETTALSLDGEEKSRQQHQCYYGADGKVQKVPIGPPPKEDKKRGLRGKKQAEKKAEIQASMKEAAALLHGYVPLDPARIQAAKAAGNISVDVPGASGPISVTIKSYLKPGDQVVVVMDPAKNTLQSLAISSFTEKEKEKSPVSGSVSFAALEDGTLYPAKETLDITAQKLKVIVENSGYRKHTP